MTIRFTKGRLGKPDTLACFRDDGTETWEHSRAGVQHDLIHYAVETTLGYTRAFYGLVASGRDIASFGTKNGRKDVYPDEALWSECIVGLLQWPSVNGGPAVGDGEFHTLLAVACAQEGRPTPGVSAECLAVIRRLVQTLHSRWGGLTAGETLELAFGHEKRQDDFHA